MHIAMTDLKDQHNAIKDEINEAIGRVIDSGRFILGPEVEAFEAEMAAYCGTRFAIGVASGTDALILGLKGCGINPGDEVITTPFTFIATAEAITHCGATPVFVDIDPRTYNIDPDRIQEKITTKTRAILPVHLYGQPVEMASILGLAKRFNLKVIEDCAQALSADYSGKKVGSLGDAGCLSFFPSKNLGAYGDGGMVLTDDPQIAETVKILRQHGQKISYHHVLPGFNSRLDAIQAAILRVKLKHLDDWSEMRRRNYSLYNNLLSEIAGVEPTYVIEHVKISANYYTVGLSDNRISRDGLRQYLDAHDIDTAVYYPISLHLQEAYGSLGYKPGDFPESERAQGQVLSFPMYPEIRPEQASEIFNKVKEYVNSQP